MARVLDLNEIQSSFMDLTLRDEKRTVVHLDIPQEAQIAELQALHKNMEQLKTGDMAATRAVYELMASLVNCNLDFFHVTAEELPTKYGMNLVVALKFFSSYMTFVEELANSKN